MQNLFNNTILIPYHDSLASEGVEPAQIPNQLEAFGRTVLKKPAVLQKQFSITLSSDNKTTESTYCQTIRGLSVTREVEKRRSGGEALYEMKMPGPISYGEVVLSHVYTNSEAFLNWLINGASQGGAVLADLTIKVGDTPENGQMVYTLRDAFPIQWRMGNITILTVNEIEYKRTIQMEAGNFPLEEVTVAYGRMDYSVE